MSTVSYVLVERGIRRRADGDGTRHVRRAVQILRAGIDKIERARLDLAVALLAHAVMHNRAVRPGTRDRGEAQTLDQVILTSEGFEPIGRADLGDRAGGRRTAGGLEVDDDEEE